MGFLSYCMNLSLDIMSSCLRRYSVLLNTLDACWIAVDEWSNSSRCRIVSIYLFWTWCLYTWSLPRYTHNYAQFCQLLNRNLFTHHRILMLLREATSETYGPRVYSHHINLYHFIYLLCFYFAFYFLLCIYLSKIPKILFIISIRSHYRKWPWRDWQPLIALVASSYRFV